MTMEQRMVEASKLGRELAQIEKKARGYIPGAAIETIGRNLFSYEDERTSFMAGFRAEQRRLVGIRD